jgi:hypothetical protein
MTTEEQILQQIQELQIRLADLRKAKPTDAERNKQIRRDIEEWAKEQEEVNQSIPNRK